MHIDMGTIAVFGGIVEGILAILIFIVYYYGGKQQRLIYLTISQLLLGLGAFVFYLNGNIHMIIAATVIMLGIVFMINALDAPKGRFGYYLLLIPIFSLLQGIAFSILIPTIWLRVLLNLLCYSYLFLVGVRILWKSTRQTGERIYVWMLACLVIAVMMMFIRTIALNFSPPSSSSASSVNIVWMLTIASMFIAISFSLVIVHMRQLSNDLEKMVEMKKNNLKANYNQMIKFYDTSKEPIAILDSDCRYLFCNKTSELLTGITMKEKVGRIFWDIFPADKGSLFGGKIVEVIGTKQPQHFEFKSAYFECWLNVHIYPFSDGCIINYININEIKQLENEKIRMDRMNIIGQMAASIGHEIRNPMTTVRGYLQFLGKKEKLQDYREQMALMIDELDRANAIITEYLSLAKNKVVDMKQGDINQVITMLFPLLRSDALLMGHSIETDLSEIPHVLFDSNDIRQLLLNLTRNAFEAMESGGQVVIKTYLKDYKVVMAICDNGPGLPEYVMLNLGTPFTTTKDNGTGLGLSVCYGIAERHKAKFEVESNQYGTTFFVEFHTAELGA